MKRFILGLIFLTTIIVLESSCSPKPSGYTKTTKLGDFKIKIIDSCEYIEYDNGSIMGDHVYSITHKGNCKFCIERNNKH